MKKIELKVSFNCNKCKTQVLKAVAKLDGVDQLTVDVQKGMLMVIGVVDPVRVTTKIRETGKNAALISVGPLEQPGPKPAPKPAPKPDPTGDPKPETPLPHCCKQCQVIVTRYDTYDFDSRMCTIL